MKASYHTSKRQGAASHNDRTFDVSKAPHINPKKIRDNYYWCWKDGMEFEKAELLFYRKHYAEMLKAQNKYRKVKRNIKEYLELPRYKPEEFILQIGNMKDQPNDPEIFKECFFDYIDFLENWNMEHGGHLNLLDYAIHKDEATPHAHVRMIWDYVNDHGIRWISRDRALKQAGIGLADPNRPESRTNTRKKAFDRMCREKWIQICRERGLQIEHADVYDQEASNMDTIAKEKHKTIPDYKRDLILTEIEAMRSDTRKISNIVNTAMAEIPPEKITHDQDGSVMISLDREEYDRLRQKAEQIRQSKIRQQSHRMEITESVRKTEEYQRQQKTFTEYSADVKAKKESMLEQAAKTYSADELADIIHAGEDAIRTSPEAMQKIMADFYHTDVELTRGNNAENQETDLQDKEEFEQDEKE